MPSQSTPSKSTLSRLLAGGGLLEPLCAPRVTIGAGDPVSPGVMPQLAAELFGPVPIWFDTPLSVDPQARTEIDYVELADLVRELSGALHEAGMRPWDRLAVIKTGNYDTLVLAAAAARIGAIPALISPHLEGEAIRVLLTRLRSPFVYTDQETVDATQLPVSDWQHLTRRVIGPVAGGTPLEDLYGARVPDPAPRAGSEPVFITHTGGTTGIPKLVEQSVTGASAVVNVESRRWLFGYSPSETVGSCLTFVHGRAIYQMTAFLSRGTRFVAVCDPDPENVRSTFATHKPTIVESHPNTFLRWESLCSDPSQPFGNVRLYYNSFDAMHPRMIRHLLDASRRRLPLYCQGYGMSEVGVISLRLYTRRSIRRLGRMGMGSRNVGWPLPGDSRVRIVDGDTMRPVLRGSSGRIQVRSRGLTAGFAEQEEKYWARRHGDWFDTGDIGRQGPFGSVELLDREVDRIEGIDSCIGVEDVLFDRLPELREVVIVGDDEGEPVPIVVMKGDQQLDLQEWNLATADFPTLRAPVQVEEMDLPRTASDKARRFIVSHRLDHDSGAGELPPLRDGA